MILPDNPVLPVFIVFCRVGGCLMTAPGFSTERVPIRIRLFFAGAVALSLAPGLSQAFEPGIREADAPRIFVAILLELTTGIALGLLARFYFLALETLGASVAMIFGLGNIFAAPVTEQEPTPAIASFLTTCALALVVLTDGHLEIIRALRASYDTAPILTPPASGDMLREIMRALSDAHFLALRICSPFLLFGLVLNLGLGLLSRLTPQVQVYFVASPLVILLGLYMLSALYADFRSAFSTHFLAFLHG